MDWLVLAVFAFVYLGMIAGRLPGLALDRTGIALLGGIAMVGFGRLTPDEALRAVDVPTMALLFGLMVVSAQLRLGGFYSEITRRISATQASPAILLALVTAAAAALSAVLANDVVCLAMAPLLVTGCLRRGLTPAPFLLALACAANVGSAATLIGNPQNMLIGQRLHLSFAGYLADALLPSVVGCVAVWMIIAAMYRSRWRCAARVVDVASPPADRWQNGKGLAVVAVLVVAFLFTPIPREVAALVAAAALLTSRRMHTRDMLGMVDWHLLVLFAGLFVVQEGMQRSGMLAAALHGASSAGVDLTTLPWLFTATVVLSNLVSNVPAVMLLLPAAVQPNAGAVLALSSTLAGNLLLVGSIANLIVVDQAARLGIHIGWREHARVGIPVTIATLVIAILWLTLRSASGM